ncbi:MAG: ABC transporter ATP-binding protein [Bacteroidales bacterium]|nr:ABC transporter ATP-binding protein [Bacteroidales bacterium]
MKVLDVKNLSLTFINNNQSARVINNISFGLNQGQTLGIVGESGSGKSLTALSIVQLIPPNAKLKAEEILFYDEGKSTDLSKLSEKELIQFRGAKISMIFQEPMTSLNPTMRCGEQVAEVIKAHQEFNNREIKNRVLELFSEVMLPDPKRVFKSYPHELSGGQKQRVMIAMAIALNPSVLIADEPTTALDVTVQKSILDLLKQIQVKYHMSIIFISHDLGIISQIADNIMVMYKGEIVEFGSAQQILKNPTNPYTIGLLKCRPTLQSNERRLPILADFRDNSTKKSEVQEFKTIRSHTTPILEVKNITKKFILDKTVFGKTKKELIAVNDVSFNVYKGETLGLVGESGSGKSTISRIITRLISENSGLIHYKGLSLKLMSRKQLKEFHKNVQIIFQDPYSSLNPKITIGEAIVEPMLVHNLFSSRTEAVKKATEILEKVRLTPDAFYKYPHEFSGGQRQRIVIARALAVQPEFIICDESVSALDVSVQAEILNLLNDFKDEFNLTYIFISHDLAVVKYMSDRIMVLQNGGLVEINKTEELYSSPASDYTKKLISSIPQIKEY